MDYLNCHTLVIGGGPGGYVAAIRAGQLGLDTMLVEAEELGGTCLNVGCIPSKALIHAADEFAKVRNFAEDDDLGISCKSPKVNINKVNAWKDSIVSKLTGGVAHLLKKNDVRVVEGRARFVDGKNVEVETKDGPVKVRAENIVIATGSIPAEIPSLPFGGDVISSTEALSLEELPKEIAIVGAGYIGLELGTALAKLGSKVVIIEAEDRILSLYDNELTRPVSKRLEALGVSIYLNSKVLGLTSDGKGLEIQAGERASKVKADKILVTVGRRPNNEGWGRENLVLDMNGPFIKIDDRCQTSMRGVYAIGDVTGEPMLAHRAMAQGEMVAEIIAGLRRTWDKRVIPAICFTDPEIVVAGLSPKEAEAQIGDVVVGKFPLSANGRALSMEAGDGFVRVVARKSDHLVLGIQCVGRAVSELSSTFGLAIEMGARLEDIAGTIHAHPTCGEALQEASLGALGHALHI